MWRRSKIVPQKPHRVHSFGGAEEVKVKKSHAEEKRCVSQEQDRSKKATQRRSKTWRRSKIVFKKPRREEAVRAA